MDEYKGYQQNINLEAFPLSSNNFMMLRLYKVSYGLGTMLHNMVDVGEFTNHTLPLLIAMAVGTNRCWAGFEWNNVNVNGDIKTVHLAMCVNMSYHTMGYHCGERQQIFRITIIYERLLVHMDSIYPEYDIYMPDGFVAIDKLYNNRSVYHTIDRYHHQDMLRKFKGESESISLPKISHDDTMPIDVIRQEILKYNKKVFYWSSAEMEEQSGNKLYKHLLEAFPYNTTGTTDLWAKGLCCVVDNARNMQKSLRNVNSVHTDIIGDIFTCITEAKETLRLVDTNIGDKLMDRYNLTRLEMKELIGKTFRKENSRHKSLCKRLG
ncbi:hypothetical protein A3Q56_00073 [Intoshia linei]|uniref:Uncharacterized protein n=1 Tax=Intoshia linei TaxID=1819745 RepID=A0A177BEY3_9BILA|nr:hypothetical protein A3Q56_00073 [Intoshia linei]